MKTKATIVGGAVLATVLVALVALFLAGRWAPEQHASPALTPAVAATAPATAEAAHRGFLYGRVTTLDGASFEGRLRWGGDEEAFWGDYFNGRKEENSWAVHVPPEELTERRTLEIFGIEMGQRQRQIDLGRPFMARFGDIARIEPDRRDLWVTLKSGTVFHLDRFEADDLADGVRVWDGEGGVVDLGERRIRAVDLLATPRLRAVPERLHGTVRTRHGDAFTGFVQWDREACVGSDELAGRATDGGELGLRYDTIRAIARESRDSSRVTLLDGREIVLAGSRQAGDGNRGVYVDDRRYGRVLVSWDAFERLDFGDAAESGPAYDDFPAGHPLAGTLTTRAGRRLSGRLVFDLDESETTETLDAPARGVDYTILFGLVAAIDLTHSEAREAERAGVTLHGGETLRLERGGDLGAGNAGMLVFAAGRERPEYVPWTDVARIDFARPPAMYPPLAGR